MFSYNATRDMFLRPTSKSCWFYNIAYITYSPVAPEYLLLRKRAYAAN